MKTADDIFCSELEKRGIEYVVAADGRYEVQVGDRTLHVSLDNVRRDYQRDGEADVIIRFADQLSTDFFTETPSWEAVQPYVRYSLEPSDYESGFDDVVCTVVNDALNQVFVYTPPDGSRITWISESRLDEWGVTREQVVQQAEQNMAAIIRETKFEIEEMDGNKLGMLSTQETPFKASLILSPAFRDLVSPTHGWPVYVVVPCRDFAFVIPSDSRDFLGRLGPTVLREYDNSGYPITQDVLEVSDDGITAVGTFAAPE